MPELTLCLCGHGPLAHTEHSGCLHCEDCPAYQEESSFQYDHEDNKEWTNIKRRVGRKKKP